MKRSQTGQVLPVMLFSFFVTLAVLTAVFNSSMLTFRKTDLVNAADAAAYSGGIEAARSLNFMAYTNRAMVENTIAVGYLVSFISYSRYLGNFLNEVSNPKQFLKKVFRNLFESSADSWEDFGGGYDSDDGSFHTAPGDHDGNSGSDDDSDGDSFHTAPESQSGNSDQNGNHGVGESFRLIGNRLKSGSQKGMKGIGSAINKAVSTLGYATIGPTDLLNTFYSGTQFATYAATGQVIKDTMSEVAQSYDDSITVSHSSHNDYYKWLFPMRPGLDVPPLVNQAGNRLARAGSNLKRYQSVEATVNPADGFQGSPALKKMFQAVSLPVTALGKVFGFNKAHVEADKNDFNAGLMQQFTMWSVTKHDAWWILWNRGWRFCFPTIVCFAPILPGPPNFAIDKDGHTDLFMAARDTTKNKDKGDNSGSHSTPGGHGSGHDSGSGGGNDSDNDGSHSSPGGHNGGHDSGSGSDGDSDSFHSAPGDHGGGHGNGSGSDDDSDDDSFHSAPGDHDGGHGSGSGSDDDSDNDSFHSAPGDDDGGHGGRDHVSSIKTPKVHKPYAVYSPASRQAAMTQPRRAVTPAHPVRTSLSCSHKRNQTDSSRLRPGGIGQTGVWIVRPHSRPSPCHVTKARKTRARLIPVAQQLQDFEGQPQLDRLSDRPDSNGSGGGSDGGSRSDAISEDQQSARDRVGLSPEQNSTLGEQYQAHERNERDVVRNSFSHSYRDRVENMRSETPGAGASQKGLIQTIKQGIRSVSDKVFDFDEVTRQHDIYGRNSSLEYGADWVASDVLSNGFFDNPIKVAIGFFKSLFGGDGIEGLKYHLEELAKGQASAKEFYAPYQGVPFYFMLAEVPFSNIHPDMTLDVTLKRPASTDNLRSFFGLGDDHGDHDMTASSASKLYYYRQPDDDQNEYFQAVSGGPIDPIIYFALTRPAFNRLKNWYGATAVFTVAWEHPDVADKLINAPDDYAEFDNVFNPFWEVRLAKRDD